MQYCPSDSIGVMTSRNEALKLRGPAITLDGVVHFGGSGGTETAITSVVNFWVVASALRCTVRRLRPSVMALRRIDQPLADQGLNACWGTSRMFEMSRIQAQWQCLNERQLKEQRNERNKG
jgi:hypothetical protein